jgi:4-hydroxyacetophenone monooxygenase
VTDKDVAIVGSAATAMQIVPAIADRVSRLTIFQRSPNWIAPSENYFREVSPEVQWLMAEIPCYYEWFRMRLSWIFSDRVHESLQVDPTWPHQERSINATNDAHRRVFTEYLRTELSDRSDLIKKALPTYPPFGKRMLLDNGWFSALKRPNVELLDEPMLGYTKDGVRSFSGQEYKADVVVLATGFEARRFFYPIDIRGRSGRSIRDVWGDDDGRAYLGMTAPDFPNMGFMYGPNTNLGHGGSYIFIAECQSRYLLGLIRQMIRHDIGAIECRVDINDAYNTKVDEAHEQMIYSHPGMNTWYRNSGGRVVTNSPWRIVDYWHMTREPSIEDFECEPVAESDSSGTVITRANS